MIDEKKLLLEISASSKSFRCIFNDTKDTVDSYYIKRADIHKGREIIKYDFHNVNEFDNLLKELFSDELYNNEELRKVIIAAVFKNRPRQSDKIVEKKIYQGNSISNYIYMF